MKYNMTIQQLIKNINKNIFIDKAAVYKFLGYKDKKMPSIIQRKVDEELDIALELIEPRIYFKRFSVDTKLNDVEDENLNKLQKCLLDSDEFCIAIYSIGDVIEKRIQTYYLKSEMIRAMILDKIGVVALDYICDALRLYILKNERHLRIKSEIYPGDKGFPIENQRIIYDNFDWVNKEILINDASVLYPLKTVSVVFSLGEKSSFKSRCETCGCNCEFQDIP